MHGSINSRIKFSDLINTDNLQSLMDNFNRVVGIANTVTDVDGNVIASSGWQEVCAKYHRGHPVTYGRCIESDTALVKAALKEAPFAVYTCHNGLTDTAAPVVIDGQHVANIISGQFFTAPPDLEFFRKQAQEFGFDEENYLAAIEAVPVISEERASTLARLYADFANMLATDGMSRLRQQEAENRLLAIDQELARCVQEKTAELSEHNRQLLLEKKILQNCKRSLIEAQHIASVGNWELDIANNTLTWSDEIFRIFEIDKEHFGASYEAFLSLIHPDDRDAVNTAYKRSLETRELYGITHRLCMADGRIKYVHEQCNTFYSREGKPVRSVGTIQDITERKQAEDRLKLAASVFTHAREGIVITDPEGNIVEVNDTFTQITGYSREESLGQNPRMLKSGSQGAEFYAAMWQDLASNGYWAGELWNRHKSGEIYAEMITISAVRDTEGKTQHYVALFTDITQMKQQQQRLEHIAHYDTLTGLPNRVLLADRLHQAMIQSQRRKQSLAVVYLDLDGFKTVNDTHSHDIGDRLLMAVSQKMKGALRECDTLARIGGDEFVALLVDLKRPQDCEPALERLLCAAAKPVRIDDIFLNVSASIGVALYPKDGKDADLLIRHADQAMYAAKQSGRNRYHLFDATHDRAVRVQRESLKHIRRALDQHEFVLHYMPKVNMKTGQVVGAEALIRWQHPERGLLLPTDFLPVIEKHPISTELGEWVIDSALAQMRAWHLQGLDIPVSVNIGAHQLQQKDFVNRLSALLAKYPDVHPGNLELEVLEASMLEGMTDAPAVMRACREMGVRFALDDFGTGNSSLAYLKHLPAEVLKIDLSLVRDMLVDPDDLSIVNGIISLGTAFSRQVIAEGVETVSHGLKLIAMGCNLAQGYGVSRSMPAAEIPGWVANWQPDEAWAA